MMATRTQHEDLSYRLSRRRSLGVLAVGVLAVAVFISVFGLTGAPPGAGPAIVLMVSLAVATSVAAILMRHRIPTQVDTSLPNELDLPLTDPRSYRSLGQRRALWLLGAAVWAGGWGVGLAAALTLHISPWLRMAVFLGATWGSVMLGAAMMRHWTGSTSWPRHDG